MTAPWDLKELDQQQVFQAAAGTPGRSKPFEQTSDTSSMVTRNPAPDASPPSQPTPSRSFSVSR